MTGFARQIVEDNWEGDINPKDLLRGAYEMKSLEAMARKQGMTVKQDTIGFKTWYKDLPAQPPLTTPGGKSFDIVRITLQALGHSGEQITDKNYDLVRVLVRFGHYVDLKFMFLKNRVMICPTYINSPDVEEVLRHIEKILAQVERVADSGTVEKAVARLRARSFRKYSS